jgi:hypothetical protein
MQSKTEQRIGDWTIWTALLIYLAVWVIAPILFPFSTLWEVSALLGAVYVGMHVYELKFRQHCYLSADSTALPVTAAFAILLFFVLRALYIPTRDIFQTYLALPVTFLIGHIAAFFYSFSLLKILGWVFRERIARENAEVRTEDTPHSSLPGQ